MKQLTILVMLGCLLLPGIAFCQEQYTLEKLIKHAVENSHAMKKAALQQSESKSKTREVIANGLPQMDGSLNYSRMGIPDINISQEMMDQLPPDIAPLLGGLADINALHTSSAGVTVSQLLYSKSYLTGIQQVKKAEELTGSLYEKTEEDVIHEVASGYYQVLMNYSNLRVLEKNIQNLEKLYNILNLQYENDFVKQTDVNRLKVNLTNLKTQKKALENGISIQERTLKIISGIPVEQQMQLDTVMAATFSFQQPLSVPYDPAVLPSFNVLKKQSELAKIQVKSDKAAYYPTLAAFGQFTYSSYATEFKFKDFNNMNTIGLKATIPIFSSGMRKQKVIQSQLKLKQNQEDFDLNTNYLETNYQNATNSMLSAFSNLQDQQENKVLAGKVYDQVKLQFDEGMASLTDLLNVESSLLEAENLFNQQLLKYKLAEIELLKATGKLKTIIN